MSIRSSLIDILMKQFNSKRDYTDDKKFADYLNKKRESNSKPYKLKYTFNKSIIVESQKIGSMQYYVFNRGYCKKTIFYFHGGSYIDKPLIFHFKFVEKLLLNKNVCVVFPIYPRLPDNNASICHKKINKLFSDFVSKNEVEEVVLMGDSAGGGLALGLAQQIKSSQPYYTFNKQKVILLSPWLDVSTDNPDIKDIQPFDYQLNQVRLNKLGKIWANGDTKQSPASPLYGDMDCGKISVITGTRDILYPDMLILKQKIESLNKEINFLTVDNMPHCFMLMPTKEADEVFNKILKLI